MINKLNLYFVNRYNYLIKLKAIPIQILYNIEEALYFNNKKEILIPLKKDIYKWKKVLQI